MTYAIEIRRQNTVSRGPWLTLGTMRAKAEAIALAEDVADELRRETRVVRYRPEFTVIKVVDRLRLGGGSQ